MWSCCLCGEGALSAELNISQLKNGQQLLGYFEESSMTMSIWKTGVFLLLPPVALCQHNRRRPCRPALPSRFPDLDIEGDGGVWDYTTVEFQSQIWNETDHAYVLGWYAGFGQVLKSLDTRHDGSKYDIFNHKGDVYLGGLLAEGESSRGRWYANSGARMYSKSDDLNPDHKDDFTVADLRLANRFLPVAENLYPVVEVTYLGDFSGINQASLIPELLYAPNDTVNLKTGLTFGAGDGNQFGGQAEIDFYF
jgi:hypothetical protein